MAIKMQFNPYSIHIKYFFSVNRSTAENLLYMPFYIFRRRRLQTLCLLRSRYYYSGDEWIRRLHDNRMWWSLGYGNPNECNCLCVQPTSDWQRLVIRKNSLLMFRYRFIILDFSIVLNQYVFEHIFTTSKMFLSNVYLPLIWDICNRPMKRHKVYPCSHM